jgi:short-subunit dehydrogenase
MKGKGIVIPGFINKVQVFLTRLLPRKTVSRVAKNYMEIK